MSFDTVHDIQAAFRSLLEAFTFPGRAVFLDAADRIALWVDDPGVVPALALGAAVLADQETTYFVEGSPALGAFLRSWTSAAPREADAAAFLVLGTHDDRSLADLVASARVGTLADPHLGATVLVGVDDLDAGSPWTLAGPGLEVPLIRNLPAGDLWPAARNQKTREFPLGLDLAFFDRRGRAMALPRTTRLTPGREA